MSLSYRVATRREFFARLKKRSMRLRVPSIAVGDVLDSGCPPLVLAPHRESLPAPASLQSVL